MSFAGGIIPPTYNFRPTDKTPTAEANPPDDSYGNIQWSRYLRGDSTKEDLKFSVCRVNEVYNKKTHRYHLVKASKPDQQKLSSKYILVLRHTFSRDGSPTGTYVDIRGDFIRDILADIYRDAENVHLAKEKASLQLRYLYYAFDELKERTQAILDEELEVKDLKAYQKGHSELLKQSAAALMLTIEEFGTTMEAVGNLVVTCDITFDVIWTLFPPNEVVFALDKLAEKRVYWAHGHEYQKEQDGSLTLRIDCGYVDDDGKKIGRAQATIIKIPQFEGKRKITDLPIFPLKYHREKNGIREELLARGRTRLEFREQRFHEYNGLGLTEVESADGERHLSKFNSRGRIVIDHGVYAQMQANDSFVPYIEKAIAEQDLTDDDILTFPSTAYGFSLKDKVWGAFAIFNITNIIWDQDIFNSLVLSDIQKRLVRTLVRSHISQSSSFDDLIREKGKGLIGLLVGPPGVGKTLTAEAVAEEVRRPLYVLGSGELGSSPKQIEVSLKRALELAQTWGAVLLLDEADVFLSKRSSHDLMQTAIVSIFLRQLEYYQGILIMTTNRVQSMDSAFESRVHFCIEYPELDHSARKRIWREFLVRAKGDKALNVQIRDNDLDEIALAQINGRQIKNVMKMAQCIAIEDKKALDVNVIKSLGDSLGGLTLSFRQ